MATNKNTEVEMRLEDIGKQLLAGAPPIEFDIVKQELEKYISKTKNEYYLLYIKEIGFFQIFFNQNKKTASDYADHIIDFVQNTTIQHNDANVQLSDIRFIEDESPEDNHFDIGLTIWFGTVYAELIPYDFGVEIVGEEY